MDHTKKFILLALLGLITFEIFWGGNVLTGQDATNFYEHLQTLYGKYISLRANIVGRNASSDVLNADETAISVELPHGQLNFTSTSFAISHSLAERVKFGEAPIFVVVVTHGLDKTTENISVFRPEDQRSLMVLAEFLQSASDYDVASCLHPSKKSVNTRDRDSEHARSAMPAHAEDLTWCKYARRNWSVVIRNTGNWSEMNISLKDPLTKAVYHVQDCNTLKGPFLIRVNKFQELGGWRPRFGQTSLLDFFFRSKGKLRIAKLKDCVWSRDIIRSDRGPLQNSKDFVDYTLLGNEHKILRIIMEDGIEWTRCAASSLCPERSYTPTVKLPEVAMPICCSVVNHNTLNRFQWAAEQMGLEYRIVYGTLLGAIRSKAIIPWTHDVDIALRKSTFKNSATYAKLQTLLGKDYYIRRNLWGMPRMLPLIPARHVLDTREFFKGPDDLEGNDELYSSQVQDAVQGMFPIKEGWRRRTYLDFYRANKEWMEGSSVVTINGKEFLTVKDAHSLLLGVYGKDYLKPSKVGNWSGLSR